jgi:hypothetical protein
VPGSYNLNQEWLETDIMEALITYNGVYPIYWPMKDIQTLERLMYNGAINIVVNIYDKDGNWIAENH